jgi:hypothetical protein
LLPLRLINQKKLSNKMKTTLLKMASVSLLAAATFCACNNKDGDDNGSTGAISGKFTIEVENGSSYSGQIDTVKLERWYADSGETKVAVFYSTSYADGKFALNLSEIVDGKHFDPIPEEMLSIFKVSNPNVKILAGTLSAYNKLGSRVGEFKLVQGDWSGFLEYVNGDVSITGAGTFYNQQLDYDMNAKKGWHVLYRNSATGKITTQAPSGMVWKYSANDD